MKNARISIIYLMLIVGLLTGCFASVEEVSTETVASVEQAFKAKPVEPNNTEKSFSYFLPSDMNVESAGQNNVILQKGEQLFILFVNPNEPKDSTEMYESTVQKTSKDKDIVNETFKDDSRFGYVKVEEIENKSYEVSVGIGGVKITTESKLSEVSVTAEQMMQIVSSVE
jgi:hypothetical protein